MENDVLAQASEVAVMDLSGAMNADENGHRRALESVDSSPSPVQRSPPSLRSPVHGVMHHESFQQEVVNDAHSRPSLEVSPLEQGNHLTSDPTAANHSLSPYQQGTTRSPGGGEAAAAAATGTAIEQIKTIIELYRLSREQLLSIYDEYVSERSQHQAQLTISMAHAQAQAAAMLNSSSLVVGGGRAHIINSDMHNSSLDHTAPHVHIQEQPDDMSSHVDVIDVATNAVPMDEMDSAGTGDSEYEGRVGEGEGEETSTATTPATLTVNGGEEDDESESSHVGKMQSLVRSALESYETASPIGSEIGQKRKHFTLEEELRLQPSPFAQQLLERDQTLVAQAIKRYMNQYSIPQREVVEKTGLNQSHLSQHFLHGVTMKRAKRIKLYHWFEEDQKARTGKLQSADGSLNAVLESPKVEGSRRRPRWKWSPISTQILTEAFKKNQFPTREQRLELSRVCNDAELAMNNGAMIRGPEGDTEGITEQRINTWFTNRRKGLTTPSTPSPTKALTPGGASLPFTTIHPTLLRAGPATTHVLTTGIRPFSSSNGTPKFSSLTTPLSLASTAGGAVSMGEDGGKPSPVALIPTTVQTLVSQIQQAQVHHHSSALSAAAAPSAQVISTSPSSHLQSSPHLALPLAIALPGGPAGVLSSSSSPHTLTTAPTPMQTVTVSPTVNPNAIHALLSQLHGTSAITAPLQLTAAAVSNSSNLVQPTSIITLPAHGAAATPVHLPHNPPPSLTSNTSSIASSPFQAVTAVNTGTSSSSSKTVDGRGGKREVIDSASTNVATLSQAQLQALMSQVQGAKVIDGTSPLAQFQLLTLPAGISLATPPTAASLNSEPPSVLWAANGPQSVPQTS